MGVKGLKDNIKKKLKETKEELIYFSQNNKALIIGGLISVLLILKFSKISFFTWIMNIISFIFEKPQEETSSYEIFRILEAVSLSYIASIIFYLINDYIPQRKRSKSALDDIKIHIDGLCYTINELIQVIKFIFEFQKEEYFNEGKALNNIVENFDKIKYSQERIYYKQVNKENNKEYTYEFIDSKNDLTLFTRDIDKTLNTMMQVFQYGDCSNSFKRLISSINTNKLIINYRELADTECGEDESFNLKGLGKSFNELENYFNELCKYSSKRFDYELITCSDTEINHYQEILKKQANKNSSKIKQQNKYGRKMYYVNDYEKPHRIG